MVDCLQEDESCDRRADCCLRSPLEELNGELRGLLAAVTLDRFPEPASPGAAPAVEA